MTDDELLAAFEAVTLSPERFGHREHLRVGFALLVREGDLACAAVAMRGGLRRFAAAAGAAAKYHETITWAYLALIAERMHGRGYTSSEQLLADHPDLLDHRAGALARSYDVAEIARSPLARAVFVLPTRT
ncbi:MAG TPA: hypothetical protein VLX92_24135 [Kofleriaceae bacterium]|nr:hypothetical protein [Kofleriaceae bacterium]